MNTLLNNNSTEDMAYKSQNGLENMKSFNTVISDLYEIEVSSFSSSLNDFFLGRCEFVKVLRW